MEKLKPSERIERIAYIEDTGSTCLTASLVFHNERLKNFILTKNEDEFVELSTLQCFFLLKNLLIFQKQIEQRERYATKQRESSKLQKIGLENVINPKPSSQEKQEPLLSDDCQNISLNMTNG